MFFYDLRTFPVKKNIPVDDRLIQTTLIFFLIRFNHHSIQYNWFIAC